MRALVIAPQPFFTPRGTPLSVYHRTRIMAELGVEIDLLTYGEGEEVDIPRARTIRIPRLPFLSPVPAGPSWPKAWRDILLAGLAVVLLVTKRYDFVHAHEESVFFCRYLKPLFRFKLVYDMHSSLPQQLVSFEFTRSRLLIRLFEALEKASLNASDAVVTISPALAEYARTILPEGRPHFLIENSILDEVRLKQPLVVSEESSHSVEDQEGRAVIAYAGTLEPYQGIDLLLEAHARVLRQRPDAFLLVIGGSRDTVEQYSQLARTLGVEEHCRFTGRLPQQTARRLLSGATLLVSPRTIGSNTPSKVYEQLASGVPLVATRVDSHTQVLNEEVCLLAEPEPEHLARVILEALESPDRSRKTAEAAQALYQARYSRESYVDKVRALIESLR